MLKQKLLCIGLLLLSSVAYAELNIMPQYKASINVGMDINHNPDRPQYGTLVLRYYQAWGDGSDTGWQQPVTLPNITLDGQPLQIWPSFAYDPTNQFVVGGCNLGFDQFAQYFMIDVPFGLTPTSTLEMTGTYEQVAYFSATLYRYDENGNSTQEGLLDKDIPNFNGMLNPYVPGNPSVFGYTSQLQKSLHTQTLQMHFAPPKKIELKLPVKKIKTTEDRTGEVKFFKLDKETSLHVIADDIARDGCSRAYLFAHKQPEQEVLIFRIKVPTTFIRNDHPDTVFGDYQTRYFSVGSHRNDYPDGSDSAGDFLNYWIVNARMLEKYKDEQGYAYVFFAPNSYSKQLAEEQHTPPNQPPVMTWGKYTGYVLGDPTYAVILRYRDPNVTWQGSPENAVCYETPVWQPVTKAELGEYLPELFGDTFANFQNGKIGAVSKDLAWPE